MSSAVESEAHYERICAFFIERITARATYLRNRAEHDLAAPAADLRLVLALEELVERLATSGLQEGELQEVHFAAALSDGQLGPHAEMADHQLRQRGKRPDIFRQDDPRPDEARVLQVLLHLREIPRLASGEAAEVIQNALQAPPASKGRART